MTVTPTSRSPSPDFRQSLPECPNGLFNFPLDSVVVTDPDEEILELYMNLASTSPQLGPRDTDTGGLGFLDSSSSILELAIDLTPTLPSDFSEAGPSSGSVVGLGDKGKRGKKRTAKVEEKGVESVEVKIQQDLGMLKGRGGDTGSVLWRSSLHLARLVLSQYHHPPSSSLPILDTVALRKANILELGAGTGLLAVLLGPLCASYTASDRMENLKLVKRNLDLNGLGAAGQVPEIGDSHKKDKGPKGGKGQSETKATVRLEEVDWIAVSEETKRHRTNSHTHDGEEETKYDMILAVDCIYNEHLIQPLVDTLARYCPVGGKTVVCVVVELRSADVLTTFLETWTSDPSGPWTIVRLGEKGLGRWDGKRARWVGWVGWR
nr:uncharacterized protein CI109_005920 [Kwoniella shandongensis]KAA5525757.1 hypothetical protein CI109_005920 [Kwoniella shandongensis]